MKKKPHKAFPYEACYTFLTDRYSAAADWSSAVAVARVARTETIGVPFGIITSTDGMSMSPA